MIILETVFRATAIAAVEALAEAMGKALKK